jgi:F420-non-reducing hydrogenase large subunit
VSRIISIDPVTRLEGAGRIEIALDASGEVERARFRVVDFKGFETFCRGRAAEEMPALTQKICGVCPTAHHIASVKALDQAFGAAPPPAAEAVRELAYQGFLFEDHLLHFLVMGGPDFLATGDAKNARNLPGLLNGPYASVIRRLLEVRARVRDLATLTSGSALYPVFGVPGGVSRPVREEDRERIRGIAEEAVGAARAALELFHEQILPSPIYSDLLEAPHLSHRLFSMGLVDGEGRLSPYDGQVRVVSPEGERFAQFEAGAFESHLEERVEPWTYVKPVFLKKVGWKGYTDGPESGIYRVGPLARLNVAEGLPTPLAQAESERMFDRLGGRPAHQTMGYHWARLIEALYAAERMQELAGEEQLTRTDVRNPSTQGGGQGTGACEAPRGTLFHQYVIDEDGIVESANLVVATQHNGAAICMSVEAAARFLIRKGVIPKNVENLVEMAFRAYDPCLACAAHRIEASGRVPSRIRILDHQGETLYNL